MMLSNGKGLLDGMINIMITTFVRILGVNGHCCACSDVGEAIGGVVALSKLIVVAGVGCCEELCIPYVPFYQPKDLSNKP